MDAASRGELISSLPQKFRDRLLSGRSIGRVARLPQTQLSACVTQAVKSISRQPALAQAVKGLVSAGLLTSAGYALRKLGLFLGAKMS